MEAIGHRLIFFRSWSSVPISHRKFFFKRINIPCAPTEKNSETTFAWLTCACEKRKLEQKNQPCWGGLRYGSLTTTEKIGKKRWKQKRKGRAGKIKERQTGLRSKFCCTNFFSSYLIHFWIGFRIVLDKRYSISYEHELYIYKFRRNKHFIVL
jgi:hypothetical protein